MFHERDFQPDGPVVGQPLPRNVKVLGWVSLCNDIASGMIFPLLPQFLLTVLKGNIFSLGVIEGAVDSASSIVKLWSGGWSDRIGSRKGLVLFGYALAAVARPLVAIITAPWQLFAIRLADRVGKGIRNSPRDALIADSVAPEIRGRAFGFNRAMDHLGAAVGPILAAVFLLFWPGQYRTLFLLAAIPGLAVVLLLVLGLREPAKTDGRCRKDYLDAAALRKGLSHLARGPGGLHPGQLQRRLSLGPRRPTRHCHGNAADPVVRVPRLQERRQHDRRPPGRSVRHKPMLLGGWALYAAIYLGFALASAQWHVWLLFMGYAMFYACTEPAEKTLVANLVGPEQRGLAYGWYNAAVGIGTLPASLLFGVLYQAFGAIDGLRSRRHVGIAGRAHALGRQGRAAGHSQNTLATPPSTSSTAPVI